MAAGIETRPYILPPLQKSAIARIVPPAPSLYIARDFKKADGDGASKTMFTRIAGALFCPGRCHAVYNARASVMKWSGRGELKAAKSLLELARMNAGLDDASSALLFGASCETAMETVLESDRSQRRDMRFDRIYPKIHFIPLDPNGIRLLRMLISPGWSERLLDALFEPGQRSRNLGSWEYDAIVDGKKILSHLDGDIARLARFREALAYRAEPAETLCFPWQTGFLAKYLGKLSGLRELEMDSVESALGM
jgi:hypothetical protein